MLFIEVEYKSRCSRSITAYKAFTLVELLVVISIIALLTGLLIPGLRLARESSRSAACSSNIRQIATANMVYSNEYRGRVVPGASNFMENLDRWFGQRDSVNEQFEPKGGPLSPYLGIDGVIRKCPAFQTYIAQSGIAFEAGCGGYGYNNAYLGISEDGKCDSKGVRLSSIKSPDRTVMFTDSAFTLAYPDVVLIEYSFAEPPLSRDKSDYRMSPSIHFRHNGNSNTIVVWADTHVDQHRMTFSADNIYGVPEIVMRELGIGWFGLAADNRLFDLE